MKGRDAFAMLMFCGSSRFAMKGLPELILSPFQDFLSGSAQVFATAVDVKIQKGHGRLEWRSFSPAASFGGAFNGLRNFCRVIAFKDA